ncbi:carbonic anhydrase, partial [Erwinia amylovora]|uniref:carbonic anhydrase n=1 Tax=Erwinia amylovora TaxID=552 RepID=UPI002961FEF8
FMSVLKYAIEYLEVSRIFLCGHYGCCGVQAALKLPDLPLNDENTALARSNTMLREALSVQLAAPKAQEDDDARLNRHVEANVQA